MRSLKFWIKVTRPLQGMLGALATYIVAALSDGQDWLAFEKIIAATVMFTGIVGASVFHYGAAHRMYARKDWDRIEVRRPDVLIFLGSLALLMSSVLALAALPLIVFGITMYNAIAIACYARWLAKHWVTKNVIIALVCTTPVLIGWLSGHRLHPALPYLATATFFAYWTREIIKDYLDIKANDGIRVTLPLWLGHERAHRSLYVAAGTTMLTITSLLGFGSTMVDAPMTAIIFYALTIVSFGAITYWLLHRTYVRKLPTFITCSNALLMVSAFCLKTLST